MIPLDKEGRPVGNHTYVKTGLLGFTNSAGSVFVSGTVAGMIKLGGRVHNSEDVRATVLAVEPPSFVHRLRVAIFAVSCSFSFYSGHGKLPLLVVRPHQRRKQTC